MFGRNSKVSLELNREVEKLIKTGGKEQLLPIVQAGEPVLRQQTAAYEGQLSRKTLDKLIETMRVTMIEAPGVGLAATQIGLGLALAVVEDHVRDDDDDDPREAAEFPFHVIINPSYEPIGTETRSFYEGCLSFDGYQAVRKRWLDIIARWQDEDGKQHEEHLHGWPARIFQHETDHLSGELYIDKAEIRSLATNENLEDFWCDDPVPDRSRRRTRIRTVNQGERTLAAIMRGTGAAESNQLRNPVVTESDRCGNPRNTLAGGRGRRRPLPFCHTVILLVIPSMRISGCNARTHRTPHGRRTYAA